MVLEEQHVDGQLSGYLDNELILPKSKYNCCKGWQMKNMFRYSWTPNIRQLETKDQQLDPKTRQLDTNAGQLDIKDQPKKFAYISKFIDIYDGAVMYIPHDMTIWFCTKDGGGSHTISCCSIVTDMTRFGKDKAIATLPFSKQLIITGPMGSQLFNLQKGYYKISYVEGSKFVGFPEYSRTLYFVDWKIKYEDGIIHKFEIKEYPSDIAVGPRFHILVTFSQICQVSCYDLKGREIFELDSLSMMPTGIFADRNYFYFIDAAGKRINRLSALGGVSRVDIPIKADNIFIKKNDIILTGDQRYLIETGEHFWPNQTYFHQAQTLTIDKQVYIDTATDIQAALVLSDSRMLLVYWNRQIELIDADCIDKTSLDSLELNLEITAFCRWNQTQILVSFSENKEIQFISWEGDSLKNKSQLNTRFGYVQVTNKAANEVVGLTISPQPQVHMIFTTEGQVTAIAIIDLEHSNVSIAASSVNLLVADIDNCKLLFYSFCGRQLSANKLKIKHRPWLVFSSGSQFYVVSASRPSVIDCYDICGQFEKEFELASRLPEIDALNGTLSVVDTIHSRVLYYRHRNWDRFQVQVKGDSKIRNVEICYGKRKEKKVIIGAMCLLLDGQMVIADWGEFQLLLISLNGDIIKQHPLPSLATDICRWGNSQFGVILPLEKQLWLVGCLSFRIRVLSLERHYIRVCQFDSTRAVCYCDQPSRLDLVTVKGSSQGDVTTITASPDYIKSIAVRHGTKDILTWGSNHLLSCNITNNDHPEKKTLFQQTHSLLGGGCTDETLLYVTDKRRHFSLNWDSQVITEYFSGDKLGDQVDVMSGYIAITEILSSTIHFQDLTEWGEHYIIPRSSKDKENIDVADVAITDNNLIAVCDKRNKSLKILSLKGRLLGTLPLESSPLGVCQITPNTLAVTLDDKNTLLAVKIQFPLSYDSYDTDIPYRHIAALSDGRLVCSWRETNYQSGINIVNMKKRTNHCIVEIEGEIRGVAVIPQNIIVVASWKGYDADIPSVFLFFNCSGKRLYKVDHVISQVYCPYSITSDDRYIYVTGDLAEGCSRSVVCLSHRGQYKCVFRHHTLNSKGEFRAIDRRAPRIVVSTGSDSLYVQGLTIDKETFSVPRLLGDVSPVNIKCLDISAQGDIIICDMVNNFIKLFRYDGQLICHKRLRARAGGVCFMGETRAALVTIPHTSQLFALDVNNSLDIVERWNTPVPYGRIYRLEQNLCFLCFSINLTYCHKVKVVGDTLEIIRECATSFHTLDMTGWKEDRYRGTVSDHKSHFQGSQQNHGEQVLRCGNYVVFYSVGSDTITVRKLPWRSSQFSLPTKTDVNKIHITLLTYDTIVISNYGDNTISLTTPEGHILHVIHTDTSPGDICQWTDDIFIVTFPGSEELVFYNKALFPIKTIQTEKGYNYVSKNKDNQLICCTQGESYLEDDIKKYQGAYIDILSVTNGSVICSKDVTDGLIFDVGVTHSSVVVLKGIEETDEEGKEYFRPVLCWYTGRGLYQYREEQTFPPDVTDPQQIAIHEKDVYLLGKGERIYHISPTDTCELYLDWKQTDCNRINSIDISKSCLIITGGLGAQSTSSQLGVRVFKI